MTPDPVDEVAWPRLRLAYALWRSADGWHNRGRLLRMYAQRAWRRLNTR